MTGTHNSLILWYKDHGRIALPWRNTSDPYTIWVSEIMLQQTQVKTVLEKYYTPFLERFSTIDLLADAPQDEVLKYWQGLGYYNRAVNLHKAAKMAGGALPQTVEGLCALPGIGKNTAHAIAAFAYHQPVPVMEANVRRVLCRVFALRQPTEKALWEKATWLLNKENPYDHNQAMMDLGALVCTKANPQCGVCPLADSCEGRGSPLDYPVKKKKKAVPVRKRDIVVFENDACEVYVTRRRTKFLNGLYGFKEYDPQEPVRLHKVQYDRAALRHIGSVTQSYSHFTLAGAVYGARVEGSGAHWKRLEEIARLPLSRADEKVLALLR